MEGDATVVFVQLHEAFSENKLWYIYGEEGFSSNRGHVTVNRFDQETYIFVQEFVGEEIDDYFGKIVTLSSDGSTLMVGARRKSSQEESYVKIYHRNNAIDVPFVLESKFSDIDRFGTSITSSANGNEVVIGTISANNEVGSVAAGSFSIYIREGGGGFSLHSRFYGKNNFDNLGHSVAISSNAIVIAASAMTDYGDTNAGSIYIYERGRDMDWHEVARFDGAKAYEYLGKNGLTVEEQGYMFLLHAKGGVGIRTYKKTFHA
eukprot:CAMPEP_0194417818 /NCGR_PEP_ID=MMETSP0176-20130528/16864_1 /TAXON_ID=216777 /ORGANISM="Proboscia alata, Strain PI-D3" /LENGTH=261 /DNA_ID=CAMNT_0039223871 /DNA_START=359 /DNA_END=1144 /DNA_ORIENTATION=-